jgi:hypothetical protein
MSNDEIEDLEEIECATNGKPTHLDMDEAFCACMHRVIEAGLENAPIGVVITPGTKNQNTSQQSPCR